MVRVMEDVAENVGYDKNKIYTVNDRKNLYSLSLKNLLEDLRSKVADPTTPILLGGLCPSMYIDHKISETNEFSSSSSAYRFPSTSITYPKMNDIILNVALENGYKFVSAEPISTVFPYFNHYLKSNDKNDIVHFSKTSQIEFGKRYFYYYNNKSIILNSVRFIPEIYDVFIILGQSNSVGRGKTEYFFDNPDGSTYNMRDASVYNYYKDDLDNKIDNSIKSFSNDSQIIDGKEVLDSIGGGGSKDDYGFGMSFARQYKKELLLASGRKILLINCGFGGTSVLGTSEDSWNLDVENNLYERSLTRIRKALSQINSSSTVKAILWHQGESDTGAIFDDSSKKISKSALYTNKLTTMLNLLRTNIASITTPILLGGLCPSKYIIHNLSYNFNSSSDSNWPDNNAISMNTLISDIASTNENYKFVSSEIIPEVIPYFNHHLKANSEEITHFNKSSQIEFGKRYFYVYNNNSIRFT